MTVQLSPPRGSAFSMHALSSLRVDGRVFGFLPVMNLKSEVVLTDWKKIKEGMKKDGETPKELSTAMLQPRVQGYQEVGLISYHTA